MSDLSRDDLEAEMHDLRARLADMERHQWVANGRIRQDTAGLTVSVGSIGLILMFMWSGAPFKWWYAVIYIVALTLSLGKATSDAYEQEQKRAY